MKWIIPALSVICVGAAQAEEAEMPATTTPADTPEWRADMPNLHDRQQFTSEGQANCRDIMHEVRSGRAMALERGSATEQDNAGSLWVYAVDYSVSGCRFLLTGQNGELRQLPTFDTKDEGIHPAQ